MKRASWKTAVLVCIGWSVCACTHIEYTQSRDTGVAKIKPDEFGAKRIDFEDYTVHTLTWLDPKGGVCAGARTGLSALGAAKTARDKAIKDKKSEYSYKYNVYAPVEGVYCGGYYSWGSGTTIARGVPSIATNPTIDDASTKSDLWELGFHAEGIQQAEEFNWITYSFGVRFAVGQYNWVNEEQANQAVYLKDYDEPVLFRTPLWGGVGLYPPFLYGFGVEMEGGIDFVAWALTDGSGAWYEKLDYDGRIAYQLKDFQPLIIGAALGYKADNLHWGEYWLKREGPMGNVSVSYVF